MAVYEYACSHCDHVTELMVKQTERPAVVECEKCQAPAHFELSATRTTFHANDRKAIKRSGR